MKIRPSSLPMLQQCPCFEAGDTSVYAEDGHNRHGALTAIVARAAGMEVPSKVEKPDELIEGLDDESREGVEWAADYIRVHAPMSDFPLRIEHRVNPLDDNLDPLFENGGTPDFVCGSHVFDFKWRPRDYTAQMAAYALALFEEGHEIVTAHVLYGQPKRAQRFSIDEPSARILVSGIIAESKEPNAQPRPCNYCGWCAKRLTCKPYTRTAKRVAEGYADEAILEQVKNWHPSQMQTAEEIALALTIARKLLGPWCKSVEFHAREMVLKQGIQLPGYELKEKAGKSHVTDVAKAHEALGLPVAELLSCCELRLNTSKTYKDRKGVIDVFAKVNELKTAPAKRAVKQKLSDLITTGKPTLALVAVGGEAEDNENES